MNKTFYCTSQSCAKYIAIKPKKQQVHCSAGLYMQVTSITLSLPLSLIKLTGQQQKNSKVHNNTVNKQVVHFVSAIIFSVLFPLPNDFLYSLYSITPLLLVSNQNSPKEAKTSGLSPTHSVSQPPLHRAQQRLRAAS